MSSGCIGAGVHFAAVSCEEDAKDKALAAGREEDTGDVRFSAASKGEGAPNGGRDGTGIHFSAVSWDGEVSREKGKANRGSTEGTAGKLKESMGSVVSGIGLASGGNASPGSRVEQGDADSLSSFGPRFLRMQSTV